MKEVVSVREFARRVGVSHTAIQKAIKTGRIQPEKSGKLDVEKAMASWGASLSHQTPKEKPAAEQPQATDQAAETQAKGKRTAPQGKPAAAVPDGASLIRSRSIIEAYKAQLVKLEYESKIGKLVPADDVKVVAFNAARRARDMIMAVPDRISPILASITNPIELHQVLSDELRKVCAEISGNYVDS